MQRKRKADRQHRNINPRNNALGVPQVVAGERLLRFYMLHPTLPHGLDARDALTWEKSRSISKAAVCEPYW